MIPMFNACLRSSYITISGNQKIILYTTVFSAVINVLLNIILINEYAVQGAVYATVITQILSLFILNIIFAETRNLFYIQVKSLIFMGIWRKR
jgi:PST family polysaccharide transporter